jgi:hypothetical protein
MGNIKKQPLDKLRGVTICSHKFYKITERSDMADFAGRRGGRGGGGRGSSGRGAPAGRGPPGRGAPPAQGRGPSAQGRGPPAGRGDFRGGGGGGRGGFGRGPPPEQSNVVSSINMILGIVAHCFEDRWHDCANGEAR